MKTKFHFRRSCSWHTSSPPGRPFHTYSMTLMLTLTLTLTLINLVPLQGGLFQPRKLLFLAVIVLVGLNLVVSAKESDSDSDLKADSLAILKIIRKKALEITRNRRAMYPEQIQLNEECCVEGNALMYILFIYYSS